MADKKYDVPDNLKYEYEKDYQSDWDTHQDWIAEFDAWEAMLQSQVFDSVSKKIDGSKITDGYTTTLAKERADRVIGKLPEGTTESVGQSDMGKAAFMDILRQKWIYPNANAQHPFLEKLNMWQFYSSVYGYMPMFYDWNVSPTGYVGPDCWLWNPRNLVPQQGKTSLADMDYVTALTWFSKKALEGIRDRAKAGQEDGWDVEALDKLIEIAENEKADQDQQRDTQIARTRTPGAVRRGICLATRYEAGEDGKWCVFAPDHGCLKLREIANPHKNGRIPFVIKYSQPLFDSFYGLGDFQRAQSIQFARDALDNYYFSGIKMNLVPPLVANANGIIKHTLDYRPGGVILETVKDSVRMLDVSNAGLSTYQAAKSTMTGSLLSQFGSQNAALPAAQALNPSQGRTPAAIDLYADKEANRDGSELRHMEAAIEELLDGMNSLIVNIGTEDIPVTLFYDDIKEIYDSGMQDIIKMFENFNPDPSLQAGELKINPEALKGVEYRFNINQNSTIKQNKQKTIVGIESMLGVLGKFPNLLEDPRIFIDWPKIMKTYEEASDIKGARDFIQIRPGPSPQEQQLMQQVQELQQQLQEAKSGLAAKQAEVQLKAQESAQELEFKREEHAMEMQQKQTEFAMDTAMKRDEHAVDMARQADEHKAAMLQSDEQHQAALKQKEKMSNEPNRSS